MRKSMLNDQLTGRFGVLILVDIPITVLQTVSGYTEYLPMYMQSISIIIRVDR